MAWNGSGVFSRVSTTVSPAVDDTTIDAADMNTYTTDVTSGINACLAKNGENAATGDLDLGSQKITALADGTAHTEAANLGQIQDAAHVYAVDSSGAANTITVAFTPAVTAYVAGQAFRVKIANDNTGATDINVNAVGAKNVLDQDGDELIGGELIASGVYTFVYDGTQFQLQAPLNKSTYVTGDGSYISTSQVAFVDLTDSTWQDITNTTGAGTHVWTALDSVPVGVDWIEVKIRQVITENSVISVSQNIFAVAEGQTQAAADLRNLVGSAGFKDNTSNNKEAFGFSTVKIPVASDGSVGINMYCSTSGSATNLSYMALVGYGWN